jgi:uncharacterized protein YbbC (DUF1343 family)
MIIKTGLENFLAIPQDRYKGFRLGLLCNPSSVDRHFTHARILIDKRYPGQLKAIYSPQHGFYAEKQDNMIESSDMTGPLYLNIPVYSLYGVTRVPTRKNARIDIDILVIDLPDVGTRVYTFSAHCFLIVLRQRRNMTIKSFITGPAESDRRKPC